MVKDGLLTNAPLFTEQARGGGFQEVWYLKLNDPASIRALWLRFTILIHGDRSKEVAEVWAIFFDRTEDRTRKTGLKNTFPIASFASLGAAAFRIGDNFLLNNETRGHVENDHNRIAWELSFSPENSGQNDFVPNVLRRLGLVKNTATTVHERLLYTGWCEMNGERFDWTNAPGMQGHLAGPKNGHSWAWGHCNSFADESGVPAAVIWDGLSARARLGTRAAPPLTSMYIRLGEEAFEINTFLDALRSDSSYDYKGWHFTATKKGYRFEGRLAARMDDFACVTYEDTDGSSLYCHNAKICDMTLTVTDPNGDKTSYVSAGTTAYEVVAREAHPDIPLVI